MEFFWFGGGVVEIFLLWEVGTFFVMRVWKFFCVGGGEIVFGAGESMKFFFSVGRG